MSRPAPEPRPGWGLFLAAALFSPLVLVAWLGGAAVLRATGWPRWRLATAATVAAVAVVWAQGGPVPALAAHFSGIAGLVAQFGRPVVHLPLPGAFLWPQVALSVPAGLLLATVQRPGVALEGPDPATVTRARRREDRTRKQAGRLVTKTAGRNFEATGLHKSALGVSLGGDLDAWRDGRYVVLPEYAARLPRLVLGRPGAGKSVYLAREAFIAGATRRQLVALDGKGDAEWAAAVVDAYLAGWEGSREPQGGAPSVHLFPAEPLDAWRGGPQAQVNRLISLWAWSVEAAYYRELCILGLRLACGAPGSPVQSMADLVGRLDPQALARCWQGHPQEAALVRGLRDRLADIQVRVANLAAATAGMLDGTRAIGEADLTVVSLPVMAMQADSEAVFRLVMADLTHWASSRKGQRPAQVMVDEFSAIDGGRDEAIHLLERGRGAGVPVILAGQSYRSLGDDDQRDRLVSAADALVLFGSATPDELVKLAGTVLDTEAVYAVEDGAWTGRASVTHRHRAKVEPNTVRQLAVGEAVIVSRGRAERLLVIPASAAGLGHNAGASRPRGRPNGPPVAGGHCVPAFPPSPAPGRLKGEDQPRPAGAAAGNPAPSDGPAGAVDEREVPPPALPRQGASPATRRPSGGLDPSGHSSVPRKRPPAPGGGSPPDDRQPQEA